MTRELIAIGIVPANDKNVKNPKTNKKEGRESKGVSGRYGPLLGRGAAGGVHPCVGSRRHHVWLRGSRSQTAVRAHPRLLPAEPTHTLEHTQLFQRGQWGGGMGHASRLPSVVPVRVLLPLAHRHVAHGPRRAPVVLLCHPAVGPRLHELFSSWNQTNVQVCVHPESHRTASPPPLAYPSSCRRRGPCWTRRDPSGPSFRDRPYWAGSSASWGSWRSFSKTPDPPLRRRDHVD